MLWLRFWGQGGKQRGQAPPMAVVRAKRYSFPLLFSQTKKERSTSRGNGNLYLCSHLNQGELYYNFFLKKTKKHVNFMKLTSKNIKTKQLFFIKLE